MRGEREVGLRSIWESELVGNRSSCCCLELFYSGPSHATNLRCPWMSSIDALDASLQDPSVEAFSRWCDDGASRLILPSGVVPGEEDDGRRLSPSLELGGATEGPDFILANFLRSSLYVSRT
jgi:hypothetical protein